MKKTASFLLLLSFLTACSSSKPSPEVVASAQAVASPAPTAHTPHIEAVRQQFAPDKRVALFAVKTNGLVLTGETNMTEAKKALLDRLQAAGISYQDSIQVLPQAELKGNHLAVVTLSVANLRSEPKHPAELATQATMGTPLRVWKQNDGWYLVQTPDKYLAWVDGAGIKLMNETTFAAWQQGEKLLYTHPYGFAYAAPNAQGATVSDLVYGDVMVLKSQSKGFHEVSFPDGRTAFVPSAEVQKYSDWTATRKPTEQNLVETSKRLLGLPYLWGGTSFKGVDCSGFTKTVYFMNGLVLPRDASQQVHVGELIDTKDGFQNLRPGDLLFFGSPAKEGKSERIIHVGMWIGNNEFIHSAGRVRINSMDPIAPNHDAYELKRFLRAKRISPEATLIDLRTASLFQ
ncbi:C40 family peptidase [Rufibacter sediminis]|uniref:C40 family peptidase n=1 Tax=Rufibacter sediminis TaxID=2762756 RepID=A0ABR6VM57_9BACT|nr:SH3 domain-containing C40 family peptidase [Rufibacter sediminis]MBC3538241.1 C40 family peptidase [Rufibacter sediminis]